MNILDLINRYLKLNEIKNFKSFLLSLFILVLFFNGCKSSLNKVDRDSHYTNSEKSIIGRVDLRKIRDSNYYKEIQEKIYNLEVSYKKKFDELASYKNEKELKETINKLSFTLDRKKEEYLQEFYERLNRAIITVANKEKIGVILTSDSILYGYKDLTQEVIDLIDKEGSNLDLNPNQTYSLKIAYLDKIEPNIDFKKLYKDKGEDILIIFDKSNVLLGGIDLTHEISKYKLSKKRENTISNK